MMLNNLLFYSFSSLSLISALMVVWSGNAVHSVLFLILVFCNVSGLLFLLGAEFIALMFIVVYVGAIAVLFLFVVMMLNIRVNSNINTHNVMTPLAIVITLLILSQLLLLINIDFVPTIVRQEIINSKIYYLLDYNIWLNSYYGWNNMETIGNVLYTEYSYLFILSSLVLLVAMIGVIVLTLHQRTEVKKQDLKVQLARESLGVVRFVKTIINK
uniref:NADH dehydrogenase subunit 6 n=1 Tax=Pseudoerythrocladia kornmannii TaxID=753682 RepID=UPI001FCD4BDE|nr:NADH dehydrogenase subunit 6 [Pseudoerythrocladia kornmannii]UNJ19036.1 NADH dehydrogenase subunit 6 [Pseudoerythrocladia kornmannii]